MRAAVRDPSTPPVPLRQRRPGTMRLVDFTRPLGPDSPVVPGDPAVTLTKVAHHSTHGYEVTNICLGSHAGTHLDAPRHFFPQGRALSDFPLDRFIGRGVIIDVRPATGGAGLDAPLDPHRLEAALQRWNTAPGERVLLWSDGKAILSEDAARVLVERGVGLVAVDGPSVDREHEETSDPASGYRVHRLLLGADILIAENLCRLGDLGEGPLQCAFLPLAVRDTDGAPVRAVGWR